MFPYPSVHGNELKQQRFEQFIEQAISAAQHCEGSRPCALEAEGNPAPCSHCDTCHAPVCTDLGVASHQCIYIQFLHIQQRVPSSFLRTVHIKRPPPNPQAAAWPSPAHAWRAQTPPRWGGGETISFILIQTLKEIKLFAIELRFRKKIICNPSKLPCVHSIHHHCTEGQEQRGLSRKPEFTRP